MAIYIARVHSNLLVEDYPTPYGVGEYNEAVAYVEDYCTRIKEIEPRFDLVLYTGDGREYERASIEYWKKYLPNPLHPKG